MNKNLNNNYNCAWLIALMFSCITHLQSQLHFDPDTVEFISIDTKPLGTGWRSVLCDDLGRIWVSTLNGIYAYNGYNFTKLNIKYSALSSKVSPVVSKAYVGDNELWVMLQHSGLLILDFKTGEQKHVSPAKIHGDKLYDYVWNIRDTGKSDSLIIHTHQGFAYIDKKTHEISPFIEPFVSQEQWETFSGRPAKYINSILDIIPNNEINGKYWMLSSILYEYNNKTNEVSHFGFTREEIANQTDLNPYGIFMDNGAIYMLAKNCGFREIDIKSKQIKSYFFENPKDAEYPEYHNTLINYKKIDDENYLFAGDTCGVFNIRTKEFKFFKVPYDKREGYGSAFNSIAIDGGGHLWYSGWLGLSRSKYPLFQTFNDSKLYLELLSIDKIQQAQFKSISTQDIINVSRKGSIQFKYYLFNPVNPDNIKYEHRLLGYEDEWKTNNPLDHINYSQLNPGKYTLEISATDSNNNYEIVNQYKIKVDGYWYDYWYSQLGLAILGIGVIIYFYNQRIEAVRREERLKLAYENKLSRLEMNALRAQMNPHFIFNSLNSIKKFLIKKGPDEASEYLTQFGKLIRIILENSKYEILSLEQELKALNLYIEMENKRFQNPFQYKIDVDPDIDIVYAKVPPMLIQPFVENAIWHGLMPKAFNRKLNINFVKLDVGILCIVEDNGVGRSVSGKPSGGLYAKKPLGYKITQERIEVINKIHNSNIKVEIEDLVDRHGSPSGTRVKIFIIGLRN